MAIPSGHVAITVRDDDDDDAPPPNEPLMEVLCYILLLIRTFFICLHAGLRIQFAFEEEQPAFEINTVFVIIAVVALFGVVNAGGCLWCMEDCLYLPEWNIYFTILKFIGSFSAFLSPFSLLMVLVLPPQLNWIGYLVVCEMFGIMVTCFYLDDHRQDKRPTAFNAMVPCIVFCLIFFALGNPVSNIWIVYPILYLALFLETAYHFITYLMFIIEKTSNSEEPHQQDTKNNNKHPRYNYLPIFRP